MIYIRQKIYSYSPSYSIKILLFAASFMLFLSLPVLSVADTVSLPQTGQTTCFDDSGNVINCTDTGQDGDTLAGVAWPIPRFTDNSDGTMTDNLTGLIWLKNADCFGLRNWPQALSDSNGLANGSCGLSDGSTAGDWRLTNINELESLVNAQHLNLATWLDTQGFTNVQSWGYCSSTSYYLQNDVWTIFIPSSIVGNIHKTTLCYVWPVRSGSVGTIKLPKTGQTTCTGDFLNNVIPCTDTPGQDGDIQSGVAWPSPRFDDKRDGTVKDKLTGLMWTKDANLPSGRRTWQQALGYVKGLNTGIYTNYGYTDWRLPNIKELLSLIDRSQFDPALQIGHPFTNMPNSLWSSTSTSASSAWSVQMRDGRGSIDTNTKTSIHYVWPVRSGSGLPSGNSEISVSPAFHDFGNVDVGDTSTAQSFTVSNNGDVYLVIDTISLTGTDVTDFSIQFDNCSGLTFAPLDTCSVDVVFSPTSERSKSSNLSIPSNDPDTPTRDVSLSGTGVIEATCDYSISPTSQTFDSSSGTGSVSVSTSDDCEWEAASNSNWINITSGNSGSGNGTVNYSVDAYTGTSPRTGTMTIAGETFTVTQTGLGTSAVPDIKANGSDLPVTLGVGETLSVDVSLVAGSSLGENCDWWVAESTPDGWYYYSLSTSWTSAGSSYTNLFPTYQGALFDLNTYEVLNTSGLPVGTYTFYFAVDNNMNGILDFDQIYYDSVVVTIVGDADENTPPTANITSPTDGYTFTVGNPIYFDGTGNDAEDGALTGSSLVWTSNIDGDIGTGGNVENSNLSMGTHTITLTATDSKGATGNDFITIALTAAGNENAPPTANITSPTNGYIFTVGNPIYFDGTGNDAEDGALTGGSLVWTSSIDGEFGTGGNIENSNLSMGTHTITLTATDSKGATGSDFITIALTEAGNGNAPPTANITSPTNGYTFTVGNSIYFDGTGNDAEDGALTGSSLVWTSSIDGEVGTGGNIENSNISWGTHTITLTATDSEGATGSVSIRISSLKNEIKTVPEVGNGGSIEGTVVCRRVRTNANAIVYIEKVGDNNYPAPAEHGVVEQMNLNFVPHVIAVQKGTTIDFLNSDIVGHNVFSTPDSCNQFNLGASDVGVSKSVLFDTTCEVPVLCNIHAEMIAYVVVMDNPYFSVTWNDGAFKIDNVPPGVYRLSAWHEKLKTVSRDVQVETGKTAIVDFELKKKK